MIRVYDMVKVIYDLEDEPWNEPDIQNALACETAEECEEYIRGDYQLDCDRVKVGDCEQYFAYGCKINGKYADFAILFFDKLEYPLHAKVVYKFVTDPDAFEYDHYDNTWDRYEDSALAIAYRGGMGYTFGIHTLGELRSRHD